MKLKQKEEIKEEPDVGSVETEGLPEMEFVNGDAAPISDSKIERALEIR